MGRFLGASMRTLAAMAVALPGGMSAAQLAVPEFVVMSDGRVIPADEKQTLPGGAPDSIVQQGSFKFNIFYQDNNGVGFRDANVGFLRQTRFEEACAYLAQVLGDNDADVETLDVLVLPSQNSNNGTLASAGTLFRDVDGYQNGNAHLRFTQLTKPSANRPEVIVEVNFFSGTPYHVGAGVPPNNQFDLQSVLLHEMIHAMGFLSLSDPDGTPPNNFSNTAFTVYDSFLIRRSSNLVLFPFNGVEPIFAGVAGDLVSENLGFNGPLARAQFGSVPPIYSPSPFENGSSMSHWDTGNIPGGAVMEHAFSPGEIIRQLPPFEAQALRDLGWLNVSTANLTRGPAAGFVAEDTTANVGEPIQFTDTTFAGSRPVIAWQWNFGDGTTSNLPNPVKTYNTGGTFNVTLTVTTSIGTDAETRNAFIQISQGPTADFTANPVAGDAPLQVQFTDTSSGNGSLITTRQWTFGDGGTSTITDPSHTYTEPGTYTVALTVTSATGSDSETKSGLIVVTGGGDDDGGGGCGGKANTAKGPEQGDALVATAMMAGLVMMARKRRK